MKQFKVWFTYDIPYQGYNEDHLIVEAANADQAWKNVMKANSHLNGFDIQSIEEIERGI